MSTQPTDTTIASITSLPGVRTPLWAIAPSQKGWFAGALFADYGTAGVSGKRKIPNCIDCRGDDLELPGGTFWRVGLDLVVPSRSRQLSYGLTAAYQRYAANAGLTQEIQIGLSVWML